MIGEFAWLTGNSGREQLKVLKALSWPHTTVLEDGHVLHVKELLGEGSRFESLEGSWREFLEVSSPERVVWKCSSANMNARCDCPLEFLIRNGFTRTAWDRCLFSLFLFCHFVRPYLVTWKLTGEVHPGQAHPRQSLRLVWSYCPHTTARILAILWTNRLKWQNSFQSVNRQQNWPTTCWPTSDSGQFQEILLKTQNRNFLLHCRTL